MTRLIAKDCAVTLSLRLTDGHGGVLDNGRRPVAYLHGGYDNLFPKLEAALEGQPVGQQVRVHLTVDDAFGPRDESLVRTIPKSEFPPGVKVGGVLRGTGDDGAEHDFHVMKIKGPVVHLDGNHPWAGRELQVTAKVLAVRDASSEEIAHRHVHGDGGHHH